jgi:hypothetical protein
MTEAKAAEKAAETADDFIEIVEQYIPGSVVIGMLIVGALVGAGVVLLWAYAEQQKENASATNTTVN